MLIDIKREILGNPPVACPIWYEASYGAVLRRLQRRDLFAILAYSCASNSSGWSMLDPMQRGRLRHVSGALPDRAVAAVLAVRLSTVPAIAKAAIAFVADRRLSWGATAALRKIPGATRVL